jgi:transketolase
MNYDPKIVNKCINTIKMLSAEAVEKAKSGHPGMPLGCADVAFILWQYFLKFNPKDTSWKGRDVFILSSGHASMLLYSLLHLYGYDVSIDDIKNFRQVASITPGHPEFGITPGVETTTGPLGQGFATGVGFALSRKILKTKAGGSCLFDGKIYSILGDGDIMEGVVNEAASIAGHLALDNIVYIYDKNDISIEGPTNLAISEDIEKRFEALGWEVISIDGFDHTQIIGALNTAKRHKGSPFLIVANTVIGKGANKKEGTSDAHGAPLGKEELNHLRKNLSWDHEEFFVPKEVYDFTFKKVKEMEKEYKKWNEEFNDLISGNVELKNFLNSKISEKLLNELRELVNEKSEATRSSSGRCMQIIAKHIPGFIGGSADLGGSNQTTLKNYDSISKSNFNGRNIHFGVREHAMGSVINGMSLIDGCFYPYGGTFLIFSDYMKDSVRLSALMDRPVTYIFTHDSIYVGEDGPTHQPIEQLSSLRMIPNINVLRPSGQAETVEAWIMALENRKKPTALILSRQNLEQIKLDQNKVYEGFKKGAYIVHKETKDLKLIIVATGSEVASSYKAIKELGISETTRLISMPCMEIFKKQDKSYIESLIPKDVKKVSVEAGVTSIWGCIVGSDGLCIGIDDFACSAPGCDVAKKAGLDVESIKQKINNFIS